MCQRACVSRRQIMIQPELWRQNRCLLTMSWISAWIMLSASTLKGWRIAPTSLLMVQSYSLCINNLRILCYIRVFYSCYFFICAYMHTRLMALCPGLPGWASTRKVKPIWISLKQKTVSGSGISWAIYASLHLAPDRQVCQHPTTQFFTGRMPFLPPNQQHQSTEGHIFTYMPEVNFFCIVYTILCCFVQHPKS